MSDGKEKRTGSVKGKLVRLPKKVEPSETIPEDAEMHADQLPKRSHTPGHLASKSHDKRKKASDLLPLRSRSQSLSQRDKEMPVGATLPRPVITTKPSTSIINGIGSGRTDIVSMHGGANGISHPAPIPSNNPLSPQSVASPASNSDTEKRPARSTSALIAPRPVAAPTAPTAPATDPPPPHRTAVPARSILPGHIAFPPLPVPRTAPDVAQAPASGMYWSAAMLSGNPRTPLRAHTSVLVGNNIYIFGGCDSKTCFNELTVLDADSFYLSTPSVVGTIPPPLRAMSCVAINKKIIVFGGGDGPVYYNSIYVLDTQNFRWSQPTVTSEHVPSKRRAHSAVIYRTGMYVFGGGNGQYALNDIWRLDVSDTKNMSWKLISHATSAGDDGDSPTRKAKPKPRGYHTSCIVGSKMIIFGGSDGGEAFSDVWIFDIESEVFTGVQMPSSYPRLSHTANIVGSYLFVIGGHDGVEYTSDVLLLNLPTMTWDKRRIYGQPLKARGYHATVLHDSRLIITGGFDGANVFGDVYLLELAVHSYYSQISHFQIEC